MTDISSKNTRTALITGSSRGIGEAIARKLAGEGIDVILNGRTIGPLETLQQQIIDTGGNARIESADLADREQVIDLANRCGQVDILVNNAASPEKYLSVLADEDEHWEKTLNILMWAPVLLTRMLGRGMKAKGYGVILNISSINAEFHAPYLAPYCMAKSSLETFTRSAAMELGPFGVRVNAISPGIIRTQLTEELLGERMNQLQGIIPVGRAGMPDEVASLVEYLCSDDAAYINGSVYKIDGGFTAGNFPQASMRNIE